MYMYICKTTVDREHAVAGLFQYREILTNSFTWQTGSGSGLSFETVTERHAE